jgi:hypothetical protein
MNPGFEGFFFLRHNYFGRSVPVVTHDRSETDGPDEPKDQFGFQLRQFSRKLFVGHQVFPLLV